MSNELVEYNHEGVPVLDPKVLARSEHGGKVARIIRREQALSLPKKDARPLAKHKKNRPLATREDESPPAERKEPVVATQNSQAVAGTNVETNNYYGDYIVTGVPERVRPAVHDSPGYRDWKPFEPEFRAPQRRQTEYRTPERQSRGELSFVKIVLALIVAFFGFLAFVVLVFVVIGGFKALADAPAVITVEIQEPPRKRTFEDYLRTPVRSAEIASSTEPGSHHRHKFAYHSAGE